LSALPVTIGNFSATPRHADIVLTWKTTLEVLNKGFEVLRSDGNTNGFTKIGFVAGAGISNDAKNYTFNDTRVQKNVKYYYRLRQVDMDNNGKYSDIRNARINASNVVSLSLQPHPFYKTAELQVNGIAAKNFRMLITDMLGNVIRNNNIVNSEEYRKLPIDLSDSPAGTYIIKVIQDDIIKTFRAIKL